MNPPDYQAELSSLKETAALWFARRRDGFTTLRAPAPPAQSGHGDMGGGRRGPLPLNEEALQEPPDDVGEHYLPAPSANSPVFRPPPRSKADLGQPDGLVAARRPLEPVAHAVDVHLLVPEDPRRVVADQAQELAVELLPLLRVHL